MSTRASDTSWYGDVEDVLDDLLAESDLPGAPASTNTLADVAPASNEEPAAGLPQSQAPGLGKQGSSAAWQAAAEQHEMAPAPTRGSTTAGPAGHQHAGAQPDVREPATLTGRLGSAQPLGVAQQPEPSASTIAEQHSHPAAAAWLQGRLRPTLSAHEPRSAPPLAEPTRLQATLSAITQQLSALEESLQPAAPPPRARMSQVFPATQRQQAVPQAPASSTPEDSRLGGSANPAAGQHCTTSPRRGSGTGQPSQAGMPLAQADSRTPVVKAGSDAVGGRQLQEQAPNADLQQTAPVPASHGSVGSQASELHQGSGLLQPQPPRVGLEQGGAARGPFQRQRFRGGSLRGSMPALGSRRRPQGTALDEHQPVVTECPEPEEAWHSRQHSHEQLRTSVEQMQAGWSKWQQQHPRRLRPLSALALSHEHLASQAPGWAATPQRQQRLCPLATAPHLRGSGGAEAHSVRHSAEVQSPLPEGQHVEGGAAAEHIRERLRSAVDREGKLRLEAEMAAMDVQRLQQQLQSLQSRLADEGQQRRQLQAELEQAQAALWEERADPVRQQLKQLQWELRGTQAAVRALEQQAAGAQAKLHSEQQRSRRLEIQLNAAQQHYQALQLHQLRPRSPDRAAHAAWKAERQQLSTQVQALLQQVGCLKQTKAKLCRHIAELQAQASSAWQSAGSEASTAKSLSLASSLQQRQPLQQGRAESQSLRSAPSCGTSHCSREPVQQDRSEPQSPAMASSPQSDGSAAAFAPHTRPQTAAMPSTSATQAHQQAAAAPQAGLQQHMQQHSDISSQLQQVLRELDAGISKLQMQHSPSPSSSRPVTPHPMSLTPTSTAQQGQHGHLQHHAGPADGCEAWSQQQSHKGTPAGRQNGGSQQQQLMEEQAAPFQLRMHLPQLLYPGTGLYGGDRTTAMRLDAAPAPTRMSAQLLEQARLQYQLDKQHIRNKRLQELQQEHPIDT